MTCLLKPVIAAACFILSAGSAQAVPYSYANINLSNLLISGLSAPGVTVSSGSIVTTDAAYYPNFPSFSNAAGGSLSGGSDALQATSGPGPFPGQNTYGQALLGSIGARADAQSTGDILTSAGINVVAEDRLATTGLSGSSASTNIDLNVAIAGTQTKTFTVSFNAGDRVEADTNLAGESAFAGVNMSFSVSGINSSFNTIVFSPDALNVSASSQDGANKLFAFQNSPYAFSISLNPGSYRFLLLAGANDRTENSAAQIPEPTSLALLGLGSLGFLASRRKSAKSKNT